MDALDEFKTTKPADNQDFRTALEELISDGVTRPVLETLVEFLSGPNKVKVSALVQAIRDDLYPQCSITHHCVVKIIGCLSNSEVSMQVKARLLRWLVVVYDYLDDTNSVRQFYDLLFANLRYEATRQWTCHLLFLTTTKEMVKPWRVRYLMELYSANKENHHLLALITLYQSLVPTLVLETLPRPRNGLFSHPDTQALDKLRRLQGQVEYTDLTSKKRIKSNIPVVRSMDGRAGAETVRTLQEFTNKVHKLEFPLQMGSVLNDGTGMLVKLLKYQAGEEHWNRLNVWLENSLDDDRILERLGAFAQQANVLPVAAQNHVLKRLEKYNGGNVEVMFCALAYLDESTQDSLLTSIENIIEFDSSKRLTCIKSLSRLEWKDRTRLDALVNKQSELELQNGKNRVLAEHVILEYFELAGVEPVEPVVLLLARSALPSSLVRLRGISPSFFKLNPEAPHLLLKSMMFMQRLKTDRDFSYDLKQSVTEASIEPTPLSYQEYLESFTLHLQDPNRVLF